MSRAFVKDGDFLEQLPERLVSGHPNDVTKAGLAQIEQALAVASEAQASTDRAAIAAAGRDLRYWPARRATTRVVPVPTDHSEVRFGTSVTIVREDGREQTFRIVRKDEADPSHGSISYVSPLGDRCSENAWAMSFTPASAKPPVAFTYDHEPLRR